MSESECTKSVSAVDINYAKLNLKLRQLSISGTVTFTRNNSTTFYTF